LDKQKLSKRKGALAVTEYRDLGYLPETILNMVAMVGWNPGTDQELFSKEELVKEFSLDHVQKSPAVFNPEKLNWFNREYMKKLSFAELKSGIMKFLPAKFANLSESMMDKLIPVIAERINYFGDVENMINDGELGYYVSAPEIDLEKISWKGEGNDKAKIHLEKAVELLQTISEADWNSESVKESIWNYAEQVGRGNVLWPMRFALSGRDKSPDPFTLADILGKTETLARLTSAVEKL
jgi:glutamyl/glutaminyl-tRNA synthetase